MKDIVWVGRSKDDLNEFPRAARREAGHQLDQVQRGLNPDDWKPLTAIGTGVKEIRIWDEAGTFRVIYIASIGTHVHVLHCFEKKSQKTSLHDLRLAQERYKRITR